LFCNREALAECDLLPMIEPVDYCLL